MDVSFCPYRTQVTYDPSTIEIAKFEVQTAKYEDPKPYTGNLEADSESFEAEQRESELAQQGKSHTDDIRHVIYV